MSTDDESASGFYESKGYSRYTLILKTEYRELLKTVSKQYVITQGEVIEVMLDNLKNDDLSEHFQAKREEKLDNRGSKTDLAKKLKNLSPEQLAQIEAIIGDK